MWIVRQKTEPVASSWIEWNSELQGIQGKVKWPYHLTMFTIFCEEENYSTPDVEEKISAFHAEMLALIGGGSLQMGRCWHKGLVQLEFRVADPEAANERLQSYIKESKSPFPFEYRMFPDAAWAIPKSYWDESLLTPAESPDVDDLAEELAEIQELTPEEELAKIEKDLTSASGEARIPLWSRRGELKTTAGDLVTAEAELKQGLTEYPQSVDLLRIYGVVLIRLKKFEEGREVFTKAIALDEFRSSLYYNLACNEALAGRADDAIAALKTSLMLERFRVIDAASDPDFESLRSRADFTKMTDLSHLGLVIGSRNQENPHSHTLLVVIPANLGPEVRGEQFETPLGAVLGEKNLGLVLGGNSRLGLGSDGLHVEQAVIEIGTDDVDGAMAVIQAYFKEKGAPAGTLLYPNTRVGEPLDPGKGIPVGTPLLS